MNKNSVQKDNVQTAVHVSAVSIIANTVLAAGKIAAGFFANSQAMVSDGVHSASDVFSSIIVIIGVKLSAKKSDRLHPYGHERFECVAAILLSVLLFLAGGAIGKGVPQKAPKGARR